MTEIPTACTFCPQGMYVVSRCEMKNRATSPYTPGPDCPYRKLAEKEAENERLREAARNFLAGYDRAAPAVENVYRFAHAHGHTYIGYQYDNDLAELRAALATEGEKGEVCMHCSQKRCEYHHPMWPNGIRPTTKPEGE